MKKYRINLTVEDYFDYVGTHPSISVRDRMLLSLPTEFRKGYNIKFKRFRSWHDFYRVHLSLITTEEEIQKILSRYYRLSNVSYKLITKYF